MIEGVPSQLQAAEMGYLQKHDATLHDKVRGCEIRKTLRVEQRLRIERLQLRWFGHVTRMFQERLARHVMLVKPTGKQPRGRPRTKWSDYISDLARYRRGVDPAEISEIADVCEVFRVLAGLLPRRFYSKKKRIGKWMNIFKTKRKIKKLTSQNYLARCLIKRDFVVKTSKQQILNFQVYLQKKLLLIF